MLEGDTEIFTTKFFWWCVCSNVGVGSQTDQFEGRDYCVWGRACQLTNVGLGAGWVAYRANFSGGSPLVARRSPRGSDANFVNERLSDQIGGNATAVLTMLFGRTRPTIVVRCVRGNITQVIAINCFGGNFGGTLEFSKKNIHFYQIFDWLFRFLSAHQ